MKLEKPTLRGLLLGTRRTPWTMAVAVLTFLFTSSAFGAEPTDSTVEVSASVSASTSAADEDDPYDYIEDTDPSALRDFRKPLEPYGQWVRDERYGTVWVPDVAVVGKDFSPYRTHGHWGVTDEGDWIWISDFDWGYIPFHYGRWTWSSTRGWLWVPGRTYAPAWVVWRVGQPGYDYVGWAPMAPSYYWRNGRAVAVAGLVTLPFWFCHSHYFFTPYWYDHIVYGPRVRVIARHTHYYHHHHHHHHHRHRRPNHRRAHGATVKGHKGAKGAKVKGAGSVSSKSKKGDMKAQVSNYRTRPVSPSFAAARVPNHAVPKKRASHNRRALGLRPTPRARRSRSTSTAGRATAVRSRRAVPARNNTSARRNTVRSRQPSTRLRRSRTIGTSTYPTLPRAGSTPRAVTTRSPRSRSSARSGRRPSAVEAGRSPRPRARSVSPARRVVKPSSAKPRRSRARRSPSPSTRRAAPRRAAPRRAAPKRTRSRTTRAPAPKVRSRPTSRPAPKRSSTSRSRSRSRSRR